MLEDVQIELTILYKIKKRIFNFINSKKNSKHSKKIKATNIGRDGESELDLRFAEKVGECMCAIYVVGSSIGWAVYNCSTIHKSSTLMQLDTCSKRSENVGL